MAKRKKQTDPAGLGGGHPPLNSVETRILGRVQRAGCELIDPTQTLTPTIKKLIAKGYLTVLPGLIPDAPQGYKVAE